MTDSPLPISTARAPKALHDRNFGKGDILTRLNINNETYRAIYSALENEMSESKLLGSNLNTLNQKERLRQALMNLEADFQHIFQPVEPAWKEKCLKALAQRCNSNQRRKSSRGGRDNISRSRPVSPSKSTPALSSQRPLGSYTLTVRRDNTYNPLLCRFRDFFPGKNMQAELTIDDLSFKKFLKILEESPVAFHNEVESVIYCNQLGESIELECERTWKAALEEMFWKNPDNINIKIEPKQAGKTLFDSSQVLDGPYEASKTCSSANLLIAVLSSLLSLPDIPFRQTATPVSQDSVVEEQSARASRQKRKTGMWSG